ncbi:alpha/beta hydrolase [Clostridium sp. CF011]|uniref:alpha/beta fold hydrolase n=1 Tax=Clostridium sp. CF011 TaxID=2843318 RepID=UPI001C0BABF4|nr:alpha/beta hydrolase [Clostridium sp. CF011]MBU3092969.1 alpha/beta hydrolase [Clostridium sp. CF011]WAG70358.1 alpha/beta hydrolase [Clostridium sp. CF011]
MNLQTKKDKRIELKGVKRFRQYVFRVLICIVVILLIGFLYEKIGEYNDAKKYSPVGEMIDVNNHKINVYSKGKGNVTVVFSSGTNTPSTYADMYSLYNEISKYNKTVVYDRPGHGWSEVTDVPRDTDSLVKEMHTALIKSGQKSPYILVGHSFASLPLIRFTQIYKNEVAGLVLIDGANPEYYAKNDSQIPNSTISKYKLLKGTGIARLALYHTDYISKNLKLLPNNLKQLYLGMALKTMYNKNIIDEFNMSGADAKTVLANGHLGDIPIRILTSENSSLDAEWENSQEALKDWSTDSMQMVVKGSTHAIHQTAPDVINNEI